MFVKKFFLLSILVTGCFCHGIAQVTDLSGVYKGSLFQGDESYTFNVTMTIKQEGKSIKGTFASESTGRSRFFVTYNIAGTTDGRTVLWKDISIADERSSGTWFWCIKMVRAAIAATRESTVLSCEWKNDGGRMFYKKLPVQNKGAACSPGSFKLYKEGEAAPFVQDTLPIAKEEPKVQHKDTTPVVKAPPKPKRTRDTALVRKERKQPVRDTAAIVKAEPKVQDTLPVVKAVTPVIKPAEPTAEVREIDIRQRIEVVSDSLTLYFYDNGVIDNDTISVYYNNAMLVSQQRLSYNPVTVTIPIRKDDSNELVMFANNEGEVPPNSALLVFTDNKIRREITMVSTLKKSGTVIFTKK